MDVEAAARGSRHDVPAELGCGAVAMAGRNWRLARADGVFGAASDAEQHDGAAARMADTPRGRQLVLHCARAAIGAGFLYLLCGDIMTVPGLPTRPGFVDIDLDTANDRVIGLF